MKCSICNNKIWFFQIRYNDIQTVAGKRLISCEYCHVKKDRDINEKWNSKEIKASLKKYYD